MDEFYVDNRGYQKLLEEVEKAERKLKNHRKTRGDSYSSSAGDGWHDNFDFEEMERQERLLNGDLQIKQERLKKAVIVDKQDNENIVDIGDVLSLTLIFGEDDEETDVYKLSGTEAFNKDENYNIVSINSPLGQAIYLKPIGETVKYNVNGNTFDVKINEKILEEEKQENKVFKKIQK